MYNKLDLMGGGIDVNRLEKVKHSRGGVTARCPACAEHGSDNTGNHLRIFPNGRYSCIIHTGQLGHEHRRRIYQLVGVRGSSAHIPLIRAIKPKPFQSIYRPTFHNLRLLKPSEMAAISDSRHWPTYAGLQMLEMRELMFYCEEGDDLKDGPCDLGTHPAWLIKDSSGICAQARRLDGKKWFLHGKHVKAKTLAHSLGSYPIGAAAIGNRSTIVLCEGGPDFCAVLGVAFMEDADYEDIAPLCITGAGNEIKDEYLHYFVDKNVIIPAHIDEDNQGMIAAKNWYAKIKKVAREVKRIKLDKVIDNQGEHIKDLSDYMGLLDPDKHLPFRVFEKCLCE